MTNSTEATKCQKCHESNADFRISHYLGNSIDRLHSDCCYDCAFRAFQTERGAKVENVYYCAMNPREATSDLRFRANEAGRPNNAQSVAQNACRDCGAPAAHKVTGCGEPACYCAQHTPDDERAVIHSVA